MNLMGRRALGLDITVVLVVSLAAAAALAAVMLPQYPMRYAAAVAISPLAAATAVGVREVGQRLRDSGERLRRAAAEHEAATQRAIEAERARIAAELHDVVTHHVSMMVVQAGAARAVLGASPAAGTADATEALAAIESSGRTAITELRAMLGLLSAEGEGSNAALAPQPGLADLDSLIGRVSAAGLAVELAVTGTPRPLPPGADLAAYRVVQESLTNVIRHACGGGPGVTVTVNWGQKLLISVIDEACGDDGAPGVPGMGRGLLGLRERLSLYGGELAAGPRPGRGWQVLAVLPV
jgi:signal transduction histidine kinase